MFSGSARRSRLDERCDIASLAVFRAGFGALMFVAIVRFWLKGFFHAQLVQPRFHFTYELLSFVRPLPAPWLACVLAGLAVCALGVMLGLFYRACIVAFGVGFVYLELIERATYLNHYYLISLVCLLLACMPAADALSLDAWRRGRERESVPAFLLWTLRAQFGVVYFFAGVAKLNADWLLRAQPLRIWLSTQREFPLLGPWLGEPWFAYLCSWSGALFDLSIVPLLCIRRTRPAAYVVVVLFHLFTGLWFPIGMFPWIMTLGATLFFPASWPRRWLRRRSAPPIAPPRPASRPLAYFLALHVCIQVALPLYLHSLGFDAAWRGRGFNFAWKVMLAERAGLVTFRVREGHEAERTIAPQRYLTPAQTQAMAQDPELVRAFARHLAAQYHAQGKRVSVYADAFLSLNGRPAQRVIDPDFDLASTAEDGFILARMP